MTFKPGDVLTTKPSGKQYLVVKLDPICSMYLIDYLMRTEQLTNGTTYGTWVSFHHIHTYYKLDIEKSKMVKRSEFIKRILLDD
jgi:hypothetical protein